MVEIIILFFLARRNGRVADSKGRAKSSYIGLTILLWFGGEILGVILGYMIYNTTGSTAALILIGLLGAAAGAVTSVLIVNNLKSKFPEGYERVGTSTASWLCPNCGHSNTSFDKEVCFNCKTPKPGNSLT